MFFEKPESPRVFQNDYLDWFTRVHFASVPILFVPIGLFELGYSIWGVQAGVWQTFALAAGGFLAWTFTEYWLHRTLFHWEPANRLGQSMHFWIHGIHHQWPADPYRLVMPPWVNLGLLLLVVGPAVLFLAPVWGWGFLAGYTTGYMNYDLTHYYLHHAKPSSKRFKRLRAHHMNHHHNHHDKRFGVSTAFWDRVFKT